MKCTLQLLLESRFPRFWLHAGVFLKRYKWRRIGILSLIWCRIGRLPDCISGLCRCRRRICLRWQTVCVYRWNSLDWSGTTPLLSTKSLGCQYLLRFLHHPRSLLASLVHKHAHQPKQREHDQQNPGCNQYRCSIIDRYTRQCFHSRVRRRHRPSCREHRWLIQMQTPLILQVYLVFSYGGSQIVVKVIGRIIHVLDK